MTAQGLAEGQGTKDISDQLDNEDQLLGASGPDQQPQVTTASTCLLSAQQMICQSAVLSVGSWAS